MQERHVAAARNLDPAELNRLAARATTHCLTGCATGEIVGLVIADIVGLAVAPSIALAVVLAFAYGFGLTITVMEIVDNAIVLLVPGAMEAGLGNPLFWASLILGLAIAWVAAFPVARWLIARGRGHALTHATHQRHGEHH